MKREAVKETPRKAFTKAEKAAILAKSDGRCAYPGCEETAGLEFDHIDMRWLKEEAHTVENGQALCSLHHKRKTKQDAKIRAHIKRLQKAEAGEKNPTTIRSRPFQKGAKKPWPKRPFQRKP